MKTRATLYAKIAERLKKIDQNLEEFCLLLKTNMLDDLDPQLRMYFQELIKIETSKRAENLKKLKAIVRKRNIRRLVHFTSLENLESILVYGLVPVESHKETQISAQLNDTKRLDQRRDLNSLSVSFPNHKLLYRFMHDYPHRRWVILAISVDILFSNKHEKYFCPSNAAAIMPSVSDHSQLSTAEAFEDMFKYEQNTWKRKLSNSAGFISKSYTTDPQAEIMIGGVIDRKYITQVIFRCKEDFDYYCSFYDRDFLKDINVRVNSTFFQKRKAVYCE
jgi:hypothetical protein